ncbi:DUF2917 domain-containing protein [uncultured Propionivibrio sp.]|uniref:DUF2917 domain-containing protein n=1 Tax=uncultured Propionivibrio sp. TaxID=426737 RepID=UPI0029C095CE|nr:DUF2917 domain-containing protein [uncultured Propionivibrio sp.]
MSYVETVSLPLAQARVVNADRVVVASGIVWLTQSGSPEDVVLRAGQSFRRERPGRIVIQPLDGEATLRLQSDGILSGLRGRIALALAALSDARRRLSGDATRSCG